MCVDPRDLASYLPRSHSRLPNHSRENRASFSSLQRLKSRNSKFVPAGTRVFSRIRLNSPRAATGWTESVPRSILITQFDPKDTAAQRVRTCATDLIAFKMWLRMHVWMTCGRALTDTRRKLTQKENIF